ncbi:MAG TPA: hypothetical protein VKA95_05605 [Nitrososphaeraceae archaeon]|nr:hypothetical protein [Nitrososphaeraceae archaeon]
MNDKEPSFVSPLGEGEGEGYCFWGYFSFGRVCKYFKITDIA